MNSRASNLSIQFTTQSFDELGVEPGDVVVAFEEPREATSAALLAAYMQSAATCVEEWIATPIWEPGVAGNQIATGIQGWQERRRAKKVGRALADQVDADSFRDAVTYTAHGMLITQIALAESSEQVDWLLDEVDPGDDQIGETWLTDSLAPYRPGSKAVEDFLSSHYPPPLDLGVLFDETAVFFDLPWLSREEGIKRKAESSDSFRQVSGDTPFAARTCEGGFPLDDPSSPLPLREQLETHTSLALQPFVIQLIEHGYCLALKDNPVPGIILDGPMRRNGAWNPYKYTNWIQTENFYVRSAKAVEKLLHLTANES